MNEKNRSTGAPGDSGASQPIDGETTPPTNYEGITTPPPPTSGPSFSSPQGTGAQLAPKSSPLYAVIIALVAAILVVLAVIGYLLLSGEENEGTATASEQQGTTTVAAAGGEVDDGEVVDIPFDPFSPENEAVYSDLDAEPAAWISPAQGIIFHSGGLDQNSAFEVREAFIERIIELAEDPATPDEMPSTITGVNAGGLGEFTCRVDMAKELNEYWECRGPDTRQVRFSPIIEGGIPNAGDSTLHRIQQGTPHDQDWKARALAHKSN